MGTYYEHYVKSSSQIFSSINQVNATHAWVTNGTGNPCDTLETPYVNNCTYDTSGNILQYFYGSLNDPVPAVSSNLISFDQGNYITLSPAAISMGSLGFVYVPTSCQQGAKCKLHVCFHGCLQSYEFVETQFIELNQFNNWAESNNVIVLYPQTSSTAALNPMACWDWWGYTGLDYATKLAPQIMAVYSMVQALIG